MEKKKILFVIESLTLAGSEKSLIALLNNLSPELYEIDLQLFQYGGELEQFVPDFVTVLSPLPYIEFVSKSLIKNFQSRNIKFLLAKLRYSIGLRFNKGNHSDKARLYWETVARSFSDQQKKYDIAIAYAQGIPTFYVMDKIMAARKVTWVNANMQFSKSNLKFQKKYYSQYDAIVPVSFLNQQHFEKIFPDLSDKLWLIPDMVDYITISKMSKFKDPDFNPETFNILTVSRLETGMKGLDIAVEAAKWLRETGKEFHWYFLGQGSFRPAMEVFIRNNHLENNITFLGTSANPYPFFKAADIYVQTSRSESYGISIAEARLLNKPIVTTRFDTVNMQMIHEKNGLVTDLNAGAVAEAIVRLMTDKELYNSIVEYLKTEEKENTEAVVLFDELIDTM
ncbi:glycosyltransferase [Kaistella daneshvariae]|uniref:Glycosyltransferase n=1 Tax=Kaistella daneshvariae TaxID=2487074 RepID=A0ABN5SWC6_9FLAO|nr:glycosyltransferase [Kaistella daneshvariae]AZI66629.1 glycosyltransferase [Kaistella daneshvariae]